jgi:protein-S-isoprenylcysteine O-methyltransferase Ste14
MTLDFGRWIEWVWLLVGLYWLQAAFRAKRVARRESWQTRALALVPLTAAFTLLFSPATRVGFLGVRLLPESSVFGWVGLVLTLAGCAFAVWARSWLGANWSATVTVKQNHELVRSGPYAIVRHPIYAGFQLGILGTVLAQGEVRSFIAFALAFIGWWTKTHIEERFMVEAFGPAYISYRRQVKQLIPFVF